MFGLLSLQLSLSAWSSELVSRDVHFHFRDVIYCIPEHIKSCWLKSQNKGIHSSVFYNRPSKCDPDVANLITARVPSDLVSLCARSIIDVDVLHVEEWGRWKVSTERRMVSPCRAAACIFNNHLLIPTVERMATVGTIYRRHAPGSESSMCSVFTTQWSLLYQG